MALQYNNRSLDEWNYQYIRKHLFLGVLRYKQCPRLQKGWCLGSMLSVVQRFHPSIHVTLMTQQQFMISSDQLYKFGGLITFHLFLLTLFDPLTIFLCWLSLLMIWGYCKLRVKRVLEGGLIVYLPEKLRKGLEERSIFDVLCDIWFMPVTTNILKAVTKPFFTSVRPDQAVSVLDELSPQVRRRFLTKGIVNILPNNLKDVLVSEKLRTKMSLREPLAITTSASSKKEEPRLVIEKGSLKESTSDTLNNRRKGQKLRLAMHKEFQDEDSLSHSSSPVIKPLDQKQEEGNHQWDKLEIYHNIRERLNSGESITQIVKSNFAIVKNLVYLKSMFFNNVSPWKVGKWMAFFLVVLILQMRLTTRNQKLIINVIRGTMGVATVLGLAGTGGLLAFKAYRFKHSPMAITNSK